MLREFAASLAPSPDRVRAAARLTVVVSIVMLAVLWLDLPGLDLAAYVVLFTYRRSTAGTVRMGLVFAVLAPLAAAAALAVWAFTADAPALRVAAFALITFVSMLMKEVPGKGMLLFALGILTVCIAVAASQAADGDLITRTLAKTCFAISIAGGASAAFAGLLWPTTQVADAPPGRPAPVPDAHTRGAFARRATAATMLGYLAYELTDWYGIHTCMFTALFIASGDVDAAAHRGWLRLAGAVAGSVAALLAIVFVVPQLDTVAGLITIVAPVTFVAAWIGAGPERFAYLGLQIALAFYLALLSRSGPTTNLHEARDRMVGVLLGVLLVALCLKGFRRRSRTPTAKLPAALLPAGV